MPDLINSYLKAKVFKLVVSIDVGDSLRVGEDDLGVCCHHLNGPASEPCAVITDDSYLGLL